MPCAGGAETPLCVELSLRVYYDLDRASAADFFEPFICGGLIGVRDSDEVYGGVGGGGGAEGAEDFLCDWQEG